MSEKSVVAVIVEGPSDENAIGGILKKYFSSDEVQFAVVRGDITSNSYTSVENVVSKIDELIDGVRSKYGYHWDDFADKYEGDLQGFIDFISDESMAVPGEYMQTWKYIEKEKNSLQRHSNMHLIFE